MYYMPPATKVLRQRRSRSTASDRFVQQRQNLIDPTPRQIDRDPRISMQQQDRSKSTEIRRIGQPPRDELYRVSRRRIVGSVLGHEREEELELERERAPSRERVPSDEGIYLPSGSGSYSSSSSLLSNPMPKSSRRYRSAEPLLMQNCHDRCRFGESGNRVRSASQTSLVQYNPEQPDCSYFYPKRPVRISESETSLATIREGVGNFPTNGRRKLERRVSEKRLFRIASMHQLPRISAVVVPRVNHELSDEEDDNFAHQEPERPSGNRYIKHRSNSYSSNNSGRQFYSAASQQHPTASLLRSSKNVTSSSTGSAAFLSDDLSLGSSSSEDRGICVHSSRDFDTDQLIGFRDRYSRRDAVDEEAISLAFLYESAAVYKYKAARGQREREQEIYEVLPPSIEICTVCKTGGTKGNNNNNSNNNVKTPSSKDLRRLIRKSSFYQH